MSRSSTITAFACLFLVSAPALFFFPEHTAASGFDRSFLQSKIIADLTADDLPGQCAIILANRRIEQWDFSNSKLEEDYAVKILTREGIEKFGDFESSMISRRYQKYKLEAYVYTPEGKKRKIGKADKKKIEIGKDYYEYRVAFPGLEVGSIIYIYQKLEYEISSLHDMRNNWNFGARVPTLKSELTIKVPRSVDLDFNFTPKNVAPAPKSEEKDLYDVYKIIMENVPPFKFEAYMPEKYINNPSVSYSVWEVNLDDYLKFIGITGNEREMWIKASKDFDIPYAAYNSWSDIGKLYADYFDRANWSEKKSSKKARKSLEEFVKRLNIDKIEDFVTDIDKLLEAFHDRYKLLNVKNVITPMNPEEVFVNGEGSSLELAYALKAILEKINIFATPVLIKDRINGSLDKRIPSIDFDRALLSIETGSGRYWIDPSCAECGVNQLPWSRRGIPGLLVRDKQNILFVETPAGFARANCLSTVDELTIDEAGTVSGVSRSIITGQYLLQLRRMAGLYRFINKTDKIKELLGEILPSYPGEEDIKIESESRDSLRLAYSYSITQPIKRTGDYIQLDFSSWCYNPLSKPFKYEKRTYDIVVPFLCKRESRVKIALPPGFEAEEIPQAVSLNSDCLEFTRICRAEGDTLVYDRMIATRARTITKDVYGKEKEIIDRIKQIDREPAVLRKRS